MKLFLVCFFYIADFVVVAAVFFPIVGDKSEEKRRCAPGIEGGCREHIYVYIVCYLCHNHKFLMQFDTVLFDRFVEVFSSIILSNLIIMMRILEYKMSVFRQERYN